MKLLKKLSAATLPAAVYLTSSLPAFAQSGNIELCPDGNFGGALCSRADSSTIIGRVITILIIIGVILALAFLIWGGIKWITSGGDKAKVEAARGTIIGAIIGLVIVLAAYFIINFVIRLLTGSDLNNLGFDPILN